MRAITDAEAVNSAARTRGLSFHRKYVMFPAVLLVVSVVVAAVFYGMLPQETAYHFEDGLPDRWMSPTAITVWLVIPQFCLFLFSLFIIVIAVLVSKRLLMVESPSMQLLLSIMGNMLALPQLILFLAMLDIFLYNTIDVHVLPIWVSAFIVMVGGGIAIAVFFLKAMRGLRTPPDNSRQEQS